MSQRCHCRAAIESEYRRLPHHLQYLQFQSSLRLAFVELVEKRVAALKTFRNPFKDLS